MTNVPSFKELVYKVERPITIEAPALRDYAELLELRERFASFNLHRHIVAINIPNNPLGNIAADPLAVGTLIRDMLSKDVIVHAPISSENMYTFVRWLLGLSMVNITNILLLAGDVKVEGSISYETALRILSDLAKGKIQYDSKAITLKNARVFFVGGALIPWRSDERSRVVYKIDNGIRFFQTQIIFNFDHLRSFLLEINSLLRGRYQFKIPILISIIPPLKSRALPLVNELAAQQGVSYFNTAEYLRNLDAFASFLREHVESLDNLKIGYHIIPFKWEDEVLSRVLDIIEIL